MQGNHYNEIYEFIRNLFNVSEDFIPLHAPVFQGNEKKYLNECIDSTFVSSVGKFVDTFEIEMANFSGAKKAVACVNGTNALHLALLLNGVTPNTEVITQAFTFIATTNAISYCNANPVFIDIDLNTLGLSASALNKWLENNTIQKTNSQSKKKETFNKNTGKKITACVPMHSFGHPAEIDSIVTICNAYNIPVIEDAAESLGSFYKGKHTGTFGQAGVISFNGNKIMTTGGGGMILFNDEEMAQKAKHLSTQAKIPHKWEFAHDSIGFNYRMPNLNAAIGLAQLEMLPHFIEKKRNLAIQYKAFFDDKQIKFIAEPANAKSNYWLNALLFENKQERDYFLENSNKYGIMTRPAWNLMTKLPMFSSCETDSLKNSLYIEERLVNIPSSVIL
jgi:perosamine synthetase